MVLADRSWILPVDSSIHNYKSSRKEDQPTIENHPMLQALASTVSLNIYQFPRHHQYLVHQASHSCSSWAVFSFTYVYSSCIFIYIYSIFFFLYFKQIHWLHPLKLLILHLKHCFSCPGFYLSKELFSKHSPSYFCVQASFSLPSFFDSANLILTFDIFFFL
jgi:hypothetical protein